MALDLSICLFILCCAIDPKVLIPYIQTISSIPAFTFLKPATTKSQASQYKIMSSHLMLVKFVIDVRTYNNTYLLVCTNSTPKGLKCYYLNVSATSKLNTYYVKLIKSVVQYSYTVQFCHKNTNYKVNKIFTRRTIVKVVLRLDIIL